MDGTRKHSGNVLWSAVAKVNNFIPELISLVANVADIFLDSTLKLYIVESACLNLYSQQECQHIKYHAEKNAEVQVCVCVCVCALLACLTNGALHII